MWDGLQIRCERAHKKEKRMKAEASLPVSTLRAGKYLQEIATIYPSLDDKTDRNVFPSFDDDASRDSFDDVSPALPEDTVAQAIVRLPDGSELVGTNRGIFHRIKDGFLPVLQNNSGKNVSDRLLSPDIRALVADTAGIWVGTACGLNYYTGGAWVAFTGADGLPILDITHLALGQDGALWIGTPQGVIRFHAGQWRTYAGRRWLADDHITGLHVADDGACWIRTVTGVAHIAFRSMTFAEKAAHYEAITAARHNRGGYVTDCRLMNQGDTDRFLYEASDNDGLWTSLYLWAESLRFAVTGDVEARKLARKSLYALLDLVRVTDIPGFPARALIRVDERVLQSDPGPNWRPSPVAPGILYKDDTSSDELAGHYLAWYAYSALVADAGERAEIAATCRAVTNHILDHHYTLVGPTGKRTTWGEWSPEVLNDDLDWAAERGLNSLEILSHLKVAIHLCGDARFADAYQSLIVQHGYALNTVRQKMLPPLAENNHSDDELAACAYYPLLMLETDPALRRLYLLSLERTQAILRPEHSPFYNFLYGALTQGRPCDAAAVQWLQDAPWDLRHWTMRNSHRADIRHDPEPGRFGEKQSLHVLSPRERRVSKWNHNPYALDGGSDGMSEEDGTFWLLPYWMGRYHGIIAKGDENTPGS
jgi:hypothetical protein